MNKIFTIIIVCFLFFPQTVNAETEEIEGVWIIEKKSGEVLTIEFSGQESRFSLSGAEEWYEGTYSVQSSTHPKQLDLHITKCSNPAYAGKTALYIYTFDDEALTLSGSEPGNPTRPLSFEDSDNTARYVFIGINYNPSDDDDDEDDPKFSLRASCFITCITK